ncbi:ThiF family adenylyltransferase [Paenibacillus sp. FSL W8-1187]|uniref:ThiF family adenylyltransferase n=1 Tax=Paenibacillus sp. FSL W8-1187 TaxID=2975339 RepID=UPI0030D885B5
MKPEARAGMVGGTEKAGRTEPGAVAGLSAERRERFSRQMRFAPIGEKGQLALFRSRVLIAGVGSLGCALAQHMARAGVGSIVLADRDYVEWSNLQRQMLFDEEDARQCLPKAVAAAKKLRRVDSGLAVEAVVADLTAPGALEKAAAGCDLVLDGTDNAAVRLRLSDWCFAHGVPLLYGGVAGASGMSAPLVPGATCCLRCLIGGEEEQESGETCDTVGMLSPAVELVAALQAAEALKWLSGSRGELRRTLATASVWPLSLRELKLPGPTRTCPACGEAGQAQRGGSGAGELSRSGSRKAEAAREARGPAVEASSARSEPQAAATVDAAFKPRKTAVLSAVLCGRDTVQVELSEPQPLDVYRRQLEAAGCAVMRNPYLLRAELPDEGARLVVFPDGRVLVQGAGDPDEALRVCERYLPVS